MSEQSTKDVMDFLLSSYRAKMAIDNTTESCPFDFTAFLSTWKEKGLSWSELKTSILKDLDPLIDQGLFDSILPYLTTSMSHSLSKRDTIVSSSDTSTTSRSRKHNNIISTEVTCSSVSPANKTIEKDATKLNSRREDLNENDEDRIEILIHVCDEAKGLRQDFKCNQSVLVQQMGYFSKVAVKGQRLRDMDISVHCDITVFDWLMRWIKANCDQNFKGNVESPKLEPSNVVGLMVSAEFLQMPNLTLECIKFTAKNIELVIQKSPNLGCLNESLTNRLSKHFDNIYVESEIVNVDKNDRITSRLYTQFILSLNETDLDMARGHFASTSSLFQCLSCGKLLINEIASKVPCTTMRFDCRGRLYSSHVKDQNWSLPNYIRDIKRELKTWRNVYWRLWGTVHFLCCGTCQLYFPAREFGSCRYHPQPPQLSKTILSSSNSEVGGAGANSKPEKVVTEEECINPFRRQRQQSQENLQATEVTVEINNLAFGSHPCCKKDGFKFYPLPAMSGCKFRDHNINQYAEDDPILKRIVIFRDLIVVESTLENTKKTFEWGGIADLTPPKLPTTSPSTPWNFGNKPPGLFQGGPVNHPLRPQQSSSTDSTSLSDTEDLTYTDLRGDSPYSPASRATPYLSEFWSWNPEYTTRYNQDMQREREEKLMADLELLLSQRVSLESSSGSSSLHNMRFGYLSRRTSKNIGGSYIKLEEKWRDEVVRNQSMKATQRLNSKSAKP